MAPLEGTIVTAPLGKQMPTFHVLAPPETLFIVMQAFVAVHAAGVAKPACEVHPWASPASEPLELSVLIYQTFSEVPLQPWFTELMM